MFTTKDPSKGFGAGVLFDVKPDSQLTEEQKKRQGVSGNGQDAQKMKKGGKVSSASKRADGCAVRGKTKCKMV
jgi:hypothetical protein